MKYIYIKIKAKINYTKELFNGINIKKNIYI